MRLILPLSALVCLLSSLTPVAAQSVAAVALAKSLQQDFAAAQALLDSGQAPWPSAESRPQPEPINALRLELPGNSIWAAFRPIDCAIRGGYRQQRKMYVDKDAGLIDRRTARTGVDALGAAIRQERQAYNPDVVECANLQVREIDNALEHDQYYAAECTMWSLADRLGLWDRQAALEAAACHLARLRARASGCQKLSAGQIRFYKNQLGCLSVMVQRAIEWQPTGYSDPVCNLSPCHVIPCGTNRCRKPASAAITRNVPVGSTTPCNTTPCATPACPPQTVANKSCAKDLCACSGALTDGTAYGPWRDTLGHSGATPVVLNRCFLRQGMEIPARNTYDRYPCAVLYRDWQYTLRDFSYGWLVYIDSAANGLWRPHGDWRELQPDASWPGARGSQTAGGL